MGRIITDSTGAMIAKAVREVQPIAIQLTGDVSIGLATTEMDGLMSAADKATLSDDPFSLVYAQSAACANAAHHNSIYRGKSLGTSITAAQLTAISSGTFEDMYIGDYWTIDSVTYRIAAFDYYWNTGDSNHALTQHHIVVMPDSSMMSSQWNALVDDKNTTAGGYVASLVRQNIKATDGPQDKIIAAFGDEHVLSYRQLYPTTYSGGNATGWAWTDARVELANEVQIYGRLVWTNGGKGSGREIGIDKWQLPLFRLRPAMANIRAGWWLRSVSSSTGACFVDNFGHAYYSYASSSLGVRPLSLIG